MGRLPHVSQARPRGVRMMVHGGAAAWALVIAALFSSAASGQTTAFTDAHWWTGDSYSHGARYVRDGVFVAGDEAGAIDDTVDLAGAFVIPPFGEAHNHNVDGVGGPFGIGVMNTRYLEDGVFYVKNPNAYAPNAEAIAPFIAQTQTIDATIAMGGITAPGGHPEPLYVEILSQVAFRGKTRDDFVGAAFHPVESREEIITALETLSAQGADFVKTYLLYSESPDGAVYPGLPGRFYGLSPELVTAVVEEAHARGFDVSVQLETAADFRAAVAAGVDEINHLPGYAWAEGYGEEDYRLTDADIAAAAQAGVVVVTTTGVSNGIYHRTPDLLAMVQALQMDNLRRLHEGGVTLAIGSDNYMQTVRVEINNLRRLAVFDDATLLQLWIDTPKAAIFPERRIGCFDAGCEASFLVMNADPFTDFAQTSDIHLKVKQGDVLP